MLGKSFDLLLLGLKHLLDKEHLSLLLNKLPSVLSVLRSLDRDGEAGGLIYFILHLWVDGNLGRFDISFTNFTEATLSGWSVFLPDFKLLIFLPLNNFSLLLQVFEREDKFVGWKFERILAFFAVE